MKFGFNKYWVFVSLGIIANIFIFVFMSNKLENYVVSSMEDSHYESIK